MSRSTLAKSHRLAEVQSPDLPLIGATPNRQGTVQDRPEGVQALDGAQTIDLCACLADAIDATTKREAAAAAMRMNHSQMTRNLKNDGHQSMKRAGYLDRETLIVYAHNILKAAGVTEDPKVQNAHDAEQAVKAILRIIARGQQ